MTSKRSNGEGTIVLRADGRWAGTITIEDEVTGAKKRKAFYGRTKKEAADKMSAALQDQKAGLVIDAPSMPLGDFLTRWLEESVKQTTRSTTYENYSVLVKKHITPKLGRIDLQKLTAMAIQRFLNERLESGLSTRSVQYLLVLLRRALRLAVKWRLVQRNVALDVDPPKVISKAARPLNIGEAKQFMGSVRGDRLEALYITTLALGLRRGEVLGLTWDDVDLAAGTLAVRRSLQRTQGKLQLLEVKTDRSRRVLLLPSIVTAALKAHKVRQLEHRLALGSSWKDRGLVFPNYCGDLYCPRRLNRQFDLVVKKAGLPKIRLHDLRHSCATLLLSQGVALKTISETLGHSTTRMTEEVYLHVFDSMKQQAAEKMDGLLAVS